LTVAGAIADALKAEVCRRFDPVGLISERAEDKPWGVLEFALRHPDNNDLRFGRPS